MSVLDLERLVAPIAEDNPTGEDLEYDAEFMELERIAQGKPERVMGNEVLAAEDPDWGEVESKAEQLLGRSKDLRVAVHLARAALARHGVAGLADGLSLVQRMLDTYWDGIHPRLDPDDDNDPTSRVNCLLPLADRAGFVAMIRAIPIVSSRQLGRFSFRDYLIAIGELQAPAAAESPPADINQIEGAFQEASVESLSETNAQLEIALASATAINSGIAERVGSGYAPDLDPLQKTLRDLRNLIVERLAQRGVGTVVSESDGGVEGAVVTARTAPGEIASREDVVAALDRVCDYYQRHEPSSPVPLILRRAQRLARMDFMEILRDMTPSGVAEAAVIGGVPANPE
jgi:type VI secretion system protein ImpA